MKTAMFAAILFVLTLGCSGPAPKAAAEISPSPVDGAPATPAAAAPTDELTQILYDMGLGRFTNNPDAPDFTVKDLGGNPVSLSQYKGKVVVLNFWATWCPPCREEMPSLEKLWAHYKGNPKFVLLAVNLSDELGKIKDFLGQTPYSMPILSDEKGQVGNLYSVTAIPTTFIIGPDGKAWGGLKGATDWASDKVIAGFDKLLARN